MLGQRLLPIALIEELRVAQPRRQHALHVARDHVGLLGLHVEHRQEHRQQLALVAGDREEMLMVNHRRRQHFLGQLEELLAERARGDDRILDQVRHFFEHALPDQRPRDASAAAPAFGIELARDAIVTLVAIEDDEVLAKPLAVVVEALDLDRAPGPPAHRQEAVAVGVGA